MKGESTFILRPGDNLENLVATCNERLLVTVKINRPIPSPCLDEKNFTREKKVSETSPFKKKKKERKKERKKKEASRSKRREETQRREKRKKKKENTIEKIKRKRILVSYVFIRPPALKGGRSNFRSFPRDSGEAKRSGVGLPAREIKTFVESQSSLAGKQAAPFSGRPSAVDRCQRTVHCGNENANR